ncbi:MAG: DMT family transporter [Oscillospiraceae bacterium]|nr:DMT family transporter [Oscillospiraceae bacterium]
MRNKVTRARLSLIASMCIFGTIGLMRRFLPVPSGFLAMTRGLLGAAFLLLLVRLRGGTLSREAIRANGWRLLVSGALIGFNWILLFEAYRYTTVATATLCYYMAPVFILLAAPFALHERLTLRKLLCVAAALLGIALVSGVKAGFSGAGEWRGILFGLSAAALYAAIVLLNKQLHDIGAYDKTIVQIGVAGAVLIPYVLLTEDLSSITLTPAVVTLLLVAGLFHTGVAYALYFGSMDALPAHSVALIGYLDPVIAVLLSALVLREPMSLTQAFGAVLILCAAVVAELPERSNAHT